MSKITSYPPQVPQELVLPAKNRPLASENNSLPMADMSKYLNFDFWKIFAHGESIQKTDHIGRCSFQIRNYPFSILEPVE